MRLDQRLVDAAIAFVERRFPGVPGEGAAAMYTEDGEILISTALEVPAGSSVALCHEVGAMCEAYAKDRKITATVCVSREPDGRMIVLPLCGVCKERMWLWGGDVEVAVPREDDTTQWRAMTLRELDPFYWGRFVGWP
jgi:cytidine deaminase